MALPRNVAKDIIDIVSHDPKCVESISSIFSNLGSYAGGSRNVMMVGADTPGHLFDLFINGFGLETSKFFPKDTWNREKWICSSIAELTSETINKAILVQKKLPEVRYAQVLKRREGIEHYATKLMMRDYNSPHP